MYEVQQSFLFLSYTRLNSLVALISTVSFFHFQNNEARGSYVI